MEDEKFYISLGFFKLCLAVSILIIGIGVYQLVPGNISGFLFLFMTLLVIISLVILRIAQLIFDRIARHRYDYQQLEALFSLYQHLDIQSVLPPMRNYAGSPDFLKLLTEQLIIHQPKLIVEASSGVSSIVISEYLSENLPESRHIALENEEKYAELTRAKIRHQKSEILHAPLKTYSLDGKNYQWYDISQLDKDLKIDLLVVDGPPKHLNPLARYPALPVLAASSIPPKLIILDDANRKDERETIRLWATTYEYDVQFFPLEKGAALLTKRNP